MIVVKEADRMHVIVIKLPGDGEAFNDLREGLAELDITPENLKMHMHNVRISDIRGVCIGSCREALVLADNQTWNYQIH